MKNIEKFILILFAIINSDYLLAQTPGPSYPGLVITSLGAAATVPVRYGAITFKYNDDNLFLIGGNANELTGKIYSSTVSRNTQCHITDFGPSAFFANANDPVLGGIDGGLAYENNTNVLFLTTYPGANICQLKPGSTVPDKNINLLTLPGYPDPTTPFGQSTGSLTFVPVGFPGAGRLKIGNYTNNGKFYDALISADGTGTYNITIQSSIDLGYTIEGIAYIKGGCSAFFPNNAILICAFDLNQIYAYDIDAIGNPLPATKRLFITSAQGCEGIGVDNATGDLLFSTFGSINQVFRVDGVTCPKNIIAAPILPAQVNGVCPVSTADLTTIAASNTPAGATLTWHTATPATAANRLANPSAVTAGTYYATFTRTASSCAGADVFLTTPVLVVIPSLVTPSFTQVASVCSGATLAPLPTTSNNSITGTWSPASNNTATTTYTFTPTIGQCANTATMTITVKPATDPACTINPCIVGTNNSFEMPVVAAGSVTLLNKSLVPDWSITPDNNIEIWSSGAFGVSPYDGNQFIEINSVGYDTVYKTFSAKAGQQLSLGFAHRGRSGTDVMRVTVGPPGGPYTVLGTYSDGNAAWVYYNNINYTILGTGTYYLRFENVSSTGGASLGNFLDGLDIELSPLPAVFAIPSAAFPTTYCMGDVAPALPLISSDGIAGTWSPATISTATSGNTNYTFTPAANQCAGATTIMITVTAKLNPTFTQVAAICAGSALAALPTTSNNGIPGTWSPVLNNTATTTYTFTPSTGLCANTATMTITVNNAITPTFTQVGSTCNGTTLAPLPISSINGITGTWSPALNNTATTTYTFTPNSGQCATTATMTILITAKITPTFTQVAPICSGTLVSALPGTSNNGISGVWSPALNNIATTTYTFTPTAGVCANAATMTIVVNPSTIPTFTQVSPICSGGVLSPLPTTLNNSITGTWSPALNNTATTTYTFTPTTGQCANTASMTITVNPKTTPTFTQVAAICNGATLSPLPTT